jgi:hypothetical protein
MKGRVARQRGNEPSLTTERVTTYEIYSKSSQLKRTSSVFCENSHNSESILMIKETEIQWDASKQSLLLPYKWCG